MYARERQPFNFRRRRRHRRVRAHPL